MSDWIAANWIWIVLALGAGWFLLRRGGAGCGMAGHGDRHEPASGPKALEGGDHDEHPATPAAPPERTRRRGGCC